MFTGIITDVGRLESRDQAPGGDTRLRIATSYDLGAVALGASISCSGACLTVVAFEGAPAEPGEGPGGAAYGGVFAVEASAETLSKTTLGAWSPGRRINLERALRVGDELGGHIVTGHVDAVGSVTSLRAEGDSTRVEILAPAALAGFIAPKGSIAIDGCSLTVNEVADDAEGCRFGVNLIPHTKVWTSFGALAQGDRVNLEIDALARYVARLQDVMRQRGES
ncbi:MAG: riboflavin synthase [Pseudomonadota bacterium]